MALRTAAYNNNIIFHYSILFFLFPSWKGHMTIYFLYTIYECGLQRI